MQTNFRDTGGGHFAQHYPAQQQMAYQQQQTDYINQDFQVIQPQIQNTSQGITHQGERTIKTDPNNPGSLIVSLSANPQHAQKKSDAVFQRSFSFEGQQANKPRQERLGSFQDQSQSYATQVRENLKYTPNQSQYFTDMRGQQVLFGNSQDQRPVTTINNMSLYEGSPFLSQRKFSTGIPIQQRAGQQQPQFPIPQQQQFIPQNMHEYSTGVRQHIRQQQIPSTFGQHMNPNAPSGSQPISNLMMPVPPQSSYYITNGQQQTFINQVHNQNFMKKPPVNGFQSIPSNLYQSGPHRQGPVQVRHDIQPLIVRNDQLKDYNQAQQEEDPDQKFQKILNSKAQAVHYPTQIQQESAYQQRVDQQVLLKHQQLSASPFIDHSSINDQQIGIYSQKPMHASNHFHPQGSTIHNLPIPAPGFEIMTVTVIPLENNLNPYPMQVSFQPEVDKNLKQVFSNKSYWDPIFRNLAPVIPPVFRVFKTTVSEYAFKQPYFKGLKLQILSLRGEGIPFPKNPNALPIEQYCTQHFFGPLVVALQTETAPPQLKSFYPEFLEILRQINEEEGRNYPAPPIPSVLNNPSYLPSLAKPQIIPQYFGSSGHESQCYAQNGNSGSELNIYRQIDSISPQQKAINDFRQMSINLNHVCTNPDLQQLSFQKRVELYLKTIDPLIFYMYRYKTTYCANKSKDHDWNRCVYAHKPFDYRRPPDRYFYSAEKCKNYNQEQGTGCSDNCQLSHTTFERLYHPYQYKTNPCQQFTSKKKTCQKGELCAFVHCHYEMRHVNACDNLFLYERLNPQSKVLYEQWQLNQFLIPELPEVNDEERKYFQKLEQASHIPHPSQNQSSGRSKPQSVNSGGSVDKVKMEAQVFLKNQTRSAISTGAASCGEGAPDYSSLFQEVNAKFDNSFNVKSKAFIPGYKKNKSINGDLNPQQVVIQDQSDVCSGIDIDINQISLSKINGELKQMNKERKCSPSPPKSPMRQKSIVYFNDQCKGKKNPVGQDDLNSYINSDEEEIANNAFSIDEQLVKDNMGFLNYSNKGGQPSQITAEDSSSMSHGTRKSSRFQHIFDQHSKGGHSRDGGSAQKSYMHRNKELYCCSEDEESSYYDSSSNHRGEQSDNEEAETSLNNDLSNLQVGITALPNKSHGNANNFTINDV